MATLKTLCTIAKSKSIVFSKENQEFAEIVLNVDDLASTMTAEIASKVHSLWTDKNMEALLPEIATLKCLPESI